MFDYTFFSVILVVLMGLLLFLFFREHKGMDGKKEANIDIYLKLIHLLFFLFVLIQFFFVVYYETNVNVGNPILIDRVSIGDLDFLNPVFSGQALINSSDVFSVFSFENIDNKELVYYSRVQFCFFYNNSDAENVLFVSDGVGVISDPIYISGVSSGNTCKDINVSVLSSDVLLGVICDDCSSGNSIYIKKGVSSNESLIVVSESSIGDYNMSSVEPYFYYLDIRKTAESKIISSYFWFIKFIWIFLFAYIVWFVFKIILGDSDDIF